MQPVEVVTQPLQVHDALVEILPPPGRKARPILAGGDAVRRQCREGVADACQWDAEPLRHPDECDTAQGFAAVAALVAAGAPAGDQSFALVEVQRGDRDTAAEGHLAGRQLVYLHDLNFS